MIAGFYRNLDNMDRDPATERASCVYRFGSAEFDEARLELKVAGLPVDVERRALAVLVYLLRHAGEVVTKEELLREVWAGRITVDKVLPNAINKLRRALGESNGECIVTQARIGYRLDGVSRRQTQARELQSLLAFKPGETMPGRENFVLVQQMSSRSGIEVWLAEHAKTRQKRVYKLCADTDLRRALKREATLSRVLQESLEDRSHFVDIIDWNFEQAPYFLESEYAGPNLAEWAKTELERLPRSARVALFLQVCDAVAAAHAVGVLHKDLKPANILVRAKSAGDSTGDNLTDSAGQMLPWQHAQHPHARLTDFGSGRLLDPDQLEKLGITQLSMTMTQNLSADSSSGTPLYIAPEVFAGMAPTAQNDVYALGILLYQLLVGQMNRPMAPGWEQDIDDDCLREDLARATDGNPSRRLASAAEFSLRLRDHPARIEHAKETARLNVETKAVRETLLRAQARKPYLIGLIVALSIGALAAGVLARQAMQARNQATVQLARASAINEFLSNDLISRANPAVLAQGASATLKDVLYAARDQFGARFEKQPGTEASIRASLAELFNTVDLLPEAQAQAESAIALYAKDAQTPISETMRVHMNLARVLARLSKYDEAKRELALLDRLAQQWPDPKAEYLRDAAWSTYLLTRADFKAAVGRLNSAIAALTKMSVGISAEPLSNAALIDALKLELITALTMTEDFSKAQNTGNDMLAELRARKGDQTLMIALAQVAMARSYSYQLQHDRAETLLRQAQPIIVARLGANHSRSINLQSELMGIAFRRADWPVAIVEAEKVHRAIVSKMGAAHSQSAMSLANWARTYFEAGQAQTAAPHVRAAYTQLKRDLGENAPQTQDTAFLLAAVELELGKLEAAAMLVQSLNPKILESYRGHGLWQAACDGLRGLLLQQQGQTAEAQPLLQTALEKLKPKTADEPEDRLYVLMRRALRASYGMKNAVSPPSLAR